MSQKSQTYPVKNDIIYSWLNVYLDQMPTKSMRFLAIYDNVLESHPYILSEKYPKY